MPEILLVRHGETVWNRERRFQGCMDSPLTSLGIDQVRAVGRRLRAVFGERLHAYELVASPLGRTWQSAVLIAETAGLDPARIRLEPQVREISWGAWDGMTAAEIEARDPEAWQRRIDDAFTLAPPNGGESRRDVLRRAQAWLGSLDPRSRVLLISHGTFGRALRCAYMGLPPRQMLALDAPQNAFFRLAQGREERIAVELAATTPVGA